MYQEQGTQRSACLRLVLRRWGHTKPGWLANLGGGIVVGKGGTACVTVEETLERIVEPGKDCLRPPMREPLEEKT